jgi:hypothetical protein
MLNQPITTKTYKKLILKIDAQHLSYVIIDLLTQKTTHLYSTKFAVFASTIKVLEEEIRKNLKKILDLAIPFDEVLVLHNNSYNSLVPAAFFNETKLNIYIQYNTKVFESDHFAFDYIERYNLYNVYVPFININNVLLDIWPEFNFKNANSVLIQKILDLSKNKEEILAFIHFQNTHFEIVVVNNQQLILFNSFEHKTVEDFIYYLLFAFEQLKLNPENINTYFLGNIQQTHPAFLMAYKYIRHVSIYDTSTFAIANGASIHENLEHFILLHA